MMRFRIYVELASPAYLGLQIIEIIIFHAYFSNVLTYTYGPRNSHLLGVRHYLNNYFAMYKRLRALVFAWTSHPPPTCG